MRLVWQNGVIGEGEDRKMGLDIEIRKSASTGVQWFAIVTEIGGNKRKRVFTGFSNRTRLLSEIFQREEAGELFSDIHPRN